MEQATATTVRTGAPPPEGWAAFVRGLRATYPKRGGADNARALDLYDKAMAAFLRRIQRPEYAADRAGQLMAVAHMAAALADVAANGEPIAAPKQMFEFLMAMRPGDENAERALRPFFDLCLDAARRCVQAGATRWANYYYGLLLQLDLSMSVGDQLGDKAAGVSPLVATFADMLGQARPRLIQACAWADRGPAEKQAFFEVLRQIAHAICTSDAPWPTLDSSLLLADRPPSLVRAVLPGRRELPPPDLTEIVPVRVTIPGLRGYGEETFPQAPQNALGQGAPTTSVHERPVTAERVTPSEQARPISGINMPARMPSQQINPGVAPGERPSSGELKAFLISRLTHESGPGGGQPGMTQVGESFNLTEAGAVPTAAPVVPAGLAAPKRPISVPDVPALRPPSGEHPTPSFADLLARAGIDPLNSPPAPVAQPVRMPVYPNLPDLTGGSGEATASAGPSAATPGAGEVWRTADLSHRMNEPGAAPNLAAVPTFDVGRPATRILGDQLSNELAAMGASDGLAELRPETTGHAPLSPINAMPGPSPGLGNLSDPGGPPVGRWRSFPGEEPTPTGARASQPGVSSPGFDPVAGAVRPRTGASQADMPLRSLASVFQTGEPAQQWHSAGPERPSTSQGPARPATGSMPAGPAGPVVSGAVGGPQQLLPMTDPGLLADGLRAPLAVPGPVLAAPAPSGVIAPTVAPTVAASGIATPVSAVDLPNEAALEEAPVESWLIHALTAKIDVPSEFRGTWGRSVFQGEVYGPSRGGQGGVALRTSSPFRALFSWGRATAPRDRIDRHSDVLTVYFGVASETGESTRTLHFDAVNAGAAVVRDRAGEARLYAVLSILVLFGCAVVGGSWAGLGFFDGDPDRIRQGLVTLGVGFLLEFVLVRCLADARAMVLAKVKTSLGEMTLLAPRAMVFELMPQAGIHPVVGTSPGATGAAGSPSSASAGSRPG
jgi:hypothetical protein